MTDNFTQIRELLSWDSKDQFYFLSIIQRKKDAKPGEKVNGTNNNSRMIKSYYIKNIGYFDFIKPEVIELCNIFNARASINLNKRSFEKTALQNLKLVTDNIINKNYDKVYKTYSSAAGKFSHDKDKKWIVDVDEIDTLSYDFEDHCELVNECQPEGDKIIAKIPSKSGYHIITKPFNVQQYNKDSRACTIQKNNPTNLFVP